VTARAAVCIGDGLVSVLSAGVDETIERDVTANDGAAVAVSVVSFGAGGAVGSEGSTLPNVAAAGDEDCWLLVTTEEFLGLALWTSGVDDGVLTTGAVTGALVDVMFDGTVVSPEVDGAPLLKAPPELRITTAGPVLLEVVVSDGDVASADWVLVLPDAETVEEGDDAGELPNAAVEPADVVFAVSVALALPAVDVVDD
jgi:hypothetical protein